MASELSMTDDHGRKIFFGGDGETGTVTVNLTDRMTAVLVSLSLAKQDEFARLYMEACRRADGGAPAMQARSATPSGVAIYDQFKDQNGHGVRVQESSLATERCVWIFCEDVTGKAWGITPHLTPGMARRVRDALDAFISEHQDEARAEPLSAVEEVSRG